MMSQDYLAVFIMIGFALALGFIIIGLSAVMGRVKKDPVKLSVYECGVPPSGTSRERFSVKFYLVAIFFLIFDVEIAFLFPWALIFKHHISLLLLMNMMIFLTILVIGYIYLWKRGGLEWD